MLQVPHDAGKVRSIHVLESLCSIPRIHTDMHTCIHAYRHTGIQACRHTCVFKIHNQKKYTHTHKQRKTLRKCVCSGFSDTYAGSAHAHAYAHVSKQLMPLHPTATPCKTWKGKHLLRVSYTFAPSVLQQPLLGTKSGRWPCYTGKMSDEDWANNLLR